jgi:hypothetical protein
MPRDQRRRDGKQQGGGDQGGPHVGCFGEHAETVRRGALSYG